MQQVKSLCAGGRGKGSGRARGGKRWAVKLSLLSLKTHSVVNQMTFVLLFHFLFLERFREPSSPKQKLSEPGCKSRLVYRGNYSWRLSALSEIVFSYPCGRYFPTTGENAKLVPKSIKFTNSTWKDAAYHRLHHGDSAWQENFLLLKCNFYSIKHTSMISVWIFLNS